MAVMAAGMACITPTSLRLQVARSFDANIDLLDDRQRIRVRAQSNDGSRKRDLQQADESGATRDFPAQGWRESHAANRSLFLGSLVQPRQSGRKRKCLAQLLVCLTKLKELSWCTSQHFHTSFCDTKAVADHNAEIFIDPVT